MEVDFFSGLQWAINNKHYWRSWTWGFWFTQLGSFTRIGWSLAKVVDTIFQLILSRVFNLPWLWHWWLFWPINFEFIDTPNYNDIFLFLFQCSIFMEFCQFHTYWSLYYSACLILDSSSNIYAFYWSPVLWGKGKLKMRKSFVIFETKDQNNT